MYIFVIYAVSYEDHQCIYYMEANPALLLFLALLFQFRNIHASVMFNKIEMKFPPDLAMSQMQLKYGAGFIFLLSLFFTPESRAICQH